jgi:AAA ATPase domain/AAA domain, putative AbiEii toxin, Type IV TA system
MIEQIHLASFKGFHDFTLTCSQFTTLVGPNNGGKTTILQAIRLIWDVFAIAATDTSTPNMLKSDVRMISWSADPIGAINKLSPNSPEAMWLGRLTSVPCEVSVTLRGGIGIHLTVRAPRSYELDVTIEGESVRKSPNLLDREKIETIWSIRPAFMPPVAGLSPIENKLNYYDLSQKLERGLISECWRSYLFWLWNDGDKTAYTNVVASVERYLPGAKAHEPRLTHDSPERVLIEYEENGITLDMSMSGGGFRTLLGLGAILFLSKERCLLLDEPDVHLHSSLQRQVARMLWDHALESEKQVFVATHAPDFIAEMPTESLHWINREHQTSLQSDSLGDFLVELGSISKADAIRVAGKDKVLFVEGDLDEKILHRLVEVHCASSGATNCLEDKHLMIARLPGGKGTASRLSAFKRLLLESFAMDVMVVAIVDTDYDLPEPTDPNEPIVRLPRKEIENYLLDPDLLSRALNRADKKRGVESHLPTIGEIASQLNKITNDEKIAALTRYQILPRYRETLDRSLAPSTKEADAEKWFSEHWQDTLWRMRFCPGKAVLKKIKKWSQDTFNATLTNGLLVDAIENCPDDMQKVVDSVTALLRVRP